MSFIIDPWIFSVLTILLGELLLLNSLNITDINIFDIGFTYWPIFLLFLGITFLSNKDSKGEFLTGIITFFIGIIILGGNLDLFYVSLSLFWGIFGPSILILVGILSLMDHRFLG